MSHEADQRVGGNSIPVREHVKDIDLLINMDSNNKHIDWIKLGMIVFTEKTFAGDLFTLED